MVVRCAACPLHVHRVFSDMTAEEIAVMQRFKTGEITVEPGTNLLMEGVDSPHLFTVLEGMGLRYKLAEDGERQVLNFVFPGDFIGLQAGVMGRMSHSMMSASAMTLCVFRRADLLGLFERLPQRGFDVAWLAAVEERFLGEALATLGSQSARVRVAWALIRLYQRSAAVGLARDGGCPLPYRQKDLADAVGLSLVHTNKTLADLRRRQLVHWADGWLHLHAPHELARLAGIDLDRPERRPLI